VQPETEWVPADVEELAISNGFVAICVGEDEVHIALDDQLILIVVCSGEDAAIGFRTGWHTHPPLVFEAEEGCLVEMSLGDVLEALAHGSMLVAELAAAGEVELSLVLRSAAVSELRWLQPGDALTFRAVRR
jgi:hypothetical protein